MNNIWYIIIVFGILTILYSILEIIEKWDKISLWYKNKHIKQKSIEYLTDNTNLEERVIILENKIEQMAERFKSVDEIESFYKTLNIKIEKTKTMDEIHNENSTRLCQLCTYCYKFLDPCNKCNSKITNISYDEIGYHPKFEPKEKTEDEIINENFKKSCDLCKFKFVKSTCEPCNECVTEFNNIDATQKGFHPFFKYKYNNT